MEMNVPALIANYQLRQREYLIRITRAMTSRLDLPSLLALILRGAAEMAGCRAGLIVLEKEDKVRGQPNIGVAHFEIRTIYGIDPKLLPAFEPLLEFIPLAFRQEENQSEDPASVAQLELQQLVRQVEETLGRTLGQVIGIPLLFEEELLGIIYLFRSEYAFTEADEQLLQSFAHQAAIAVRNARLYQQLKAESNRLATLIENSADGIMILDANRHVQVINQALASMVGIDPQEAVDQPCSNILNLSNVQGDDLCQDSTNVSFLAERAYHCEGDLIRPGGNRITVAVTYTPLYDEAKRLVNIIVNVNDITRFREEEEMKSTFTSIISHELKTPVALIKGYAQTLARRDAAWDLETAHQGLQIIEEEADRLEALINNLLDASRIQAGGLRLDYAYVDLVNLATKVAEAYRTQTDSHMIELDFPQQIPPIWGDEERLRQVLTNLVSNAIKYSPQGGQIRLGGWTNVAPDDSNARRAILYVADQGIGIPQEELTHIFERFYRVDSGLRRSTAGTGLGLFLSKAIVDAHHGEIWARSESSKGTTFFVALPIDYGEE